MNRKQRAQALIEHLKNIRDEEGFAVVDVNIPDRAALFNPLCTPDRADLDDGIYDYIDRQTGVVPTNIPLRVRFHGDIPEAEQDKVRRAMIGHYTLKCLDISRELAANFGKMLFLALFGAAFLILYFYLTFASHNVLFSEILSIVGTFSLWEAVDAFLLERPKLRRDMKHVNQNLSQRIEFLPPDTL